MNKSKLFKQAHKLAKKVIQAGDNYRATFGACLKMLAPMFKLPSVLLDNSSSFYNAEGVFKLDDSMTVDMDINSEMFALIKSGKSFGFKRPGNTAFEIIVSEVNEFSVQAERGLLNLANVKFSFKKIYL
ncbi:hypothetical protein [Helicobacter pylori]|uniref:hypothetical protein n=1 Tax=Helicobacter pylori TaxID=210 RepID=UPI002AC6BDED|nr:hypothetical protein [Helicobacter pylori]MDZ5288584.1 hypothetical protein [Helicobacter pylori]